MSFLNIKDTVERDAIIANYLALKKPLQERNLEERSDLIVRQRDLEENFKPVVANNQKMAQNVIKGLIPIKKELKERNRNIGILREEPRLVEEDFGASPQKGFKAEMTPTLTLRQRTAAKYFKHALNNNTNDNIFGCMKTVRI